jgi:3-oxoacyl-[acyl-carrier protein] reductase
MTNAAPQHWAVVSGAAGSLGRAIAHHLAGAAWHVLAIDRSDVPSDGALVGRVADALDRASVKHALDETIPAGEPIRLLVNAVGLIWNEPLLSVQGRGLQPHRVDSWREVIDANLTAPFVVASTVAARMVRAGGGAIVNFSSVSARGNAGQPAYSAAKAGIEGLTRAMASELGPLGVRVNAVAPGFIDVPSTRAAVSADRLLSITDRTPVRRLGAIEDVLAAIDYLAAQPFVNGTVLAVDGGFAFSR